MNDKSFKNILKEWKNFLNETVGIEKIYNQIEKLEDIRNTSSLNYVIEIKKISEDEYHIGYKSEKWDMALNSKQYRHGIVKPDLFGHIVIMSSKYILSSDYDDPETEAPGKAAGEVNSTWYIRKTWDTKKGMGPLLYEVVIEFVSTRLNACIKPDPALVTEEAIAVWEKYLQRSDVTAKQLDINPNDIPYYRKEYSDKFEDKGARQLKHLTPQTSDDTSQFSAMDHMGHMWPESPLSKTYRKNNDDVIKLLESKNLIVFDI